MEKKKLESAIRLMKRAGLNSGWVKMEAKLDDGKFAFIKYFVPGHVQNIIGNDGNMRFMYVQRYGIEAYDGSILVACDDGRFADEGSDREFLKRICINYLRHECTAYEDELDRMSGEVGVREAHDLLQNRINEAIRAKYKELA